MHSFYSIDYVLRLPIRNVTRLLSKAKEEKEENLAWDLYLVVYAKMTADTFVSFEDFYKAKKKVEIQTKTEAEVLTEVKEILNSFNDGGESY